MTINRKDFLKKVCLSGACLCGFGSLAFSKQAVDTDEINSQEQAPKIALLQEWKSNLLLNANIELNEESARKLIKQTAGVPYKNLKWDTVLAEYKGDLDKFTVFLREKWGWKVDYDKEKRILIADENKNYCVCPIAVHKKDKDSSAICYCSEGFAEKMFSLVSGVQVQAEVIASIRKGDTSCKYKIVLP